MYMFVSSAFGACSFRGLGGYGRLGIALWDTFGEEFAIFDLFSVLATGIMKFGLLLPTFPTSLLTGYISSSPEKGLKRSEILRPC